MSVIHQVAHKVFANSEATIRYKIGSMIEVPRAALIADEVNDEPCSPYDVLFSI
jgi:pyruvate,orthophosphate dikinase